MAIRDSVSQFVQETKDALVAIKEHSRTLLHVASSNHTVSTMTILVTTSIKDRDDKIDLQQFYDRFTTTPIAQTCTVQGHVLLMKDPVQRVSKRGKVHNTFYNQLSLWYRDCNSKKNIKVFRNGTLHITGEKGLPENLAIATEVCNVIERILDYPINSVSVSSFNIQMINTNFCLNVGLVLQSLRNLLATDSSVPKASYEPETYPGLNTKVKTSTGREASVLIFNSGNVIITGIKSFTEFKDAYIFITRFLDANIDRVKRQNFTPACAVTINNKEASPILQSWKEELNLH